jgi:hypothetical protein
MSAEDRARIKKIEREYLQQWIENKGDSSLKAPPQAVKREARFKRLEALDSKELAQEANRAIQCFDVSLVKNPEIIEICVSLSAALTARDRLLESPNNIEEVYPRIKEIFENGLARLEQLGYWTRS